MADLCRPLVEAMFLDALSAPYLCTDATGVLVLDKDRCRHGHFWVLVVPDRHVLYRYSPKHNKAAVDALLGGYQGYLVADAHTVYDHLFADGTLNGLGGLRTLVVAEL
jgi:transposase